MAVLIEGLAAGRDQRRSVVLCGPSEELMRLFRISGLEGTVCGCKSCQQEAERLQRELVTA